MLLVLLCSVIIATKLKEIKERRYDHLLISHELEKIRTMTQPKEALTLTNQLDKDDVVYRESRKILCMLEEAQIVLQKQDVCLTQETRHQIEERFEQDISRLIHAYSILDCKYRQRYQPVIMEALVAMEQEAVEWLQEIERNKTKELDAILHVIQNRYSK